MIPYILYYMVEQRKHDLFQSARQERLARSANSNKKTFPGTGRALSFKQKLAAWISPSAPQVPCCY